MDRPGLMRPGLPHWCEKTESLGGELRYSWFVIFVLIVILILILILLFLRWCVTTVTAGGVVEREWTV